MIIFAIFVFFLLCYVLGIFAVFAIGAVIALDSVENGKDDPDYIKGKLLMQYALIWPVGIFAVLRRMEGD